MGAVADHENRIACGPDRPGRAEITSPHPTPGPRVDRQRPPALVRSDDIGTDDDRIARDVGDRRAREAPAPAAQHRVPQPPAGNAVNARQLARREGQKHEPPGDRRAGRGQEPRFVGRAGKFPAQLTGGAIDRDRPVVPGHGNDQAACSGRGGAERRAEVLAPLDFARACAERQDLAEARGRVDRVAIGCQPASKALVAILALWRKAGFPIPAA